MSRKFCRDSKGRTSLAAASRSKQSSSGVVAHVRQTSAESQSVPESLSTRSPTTALPNDPPRSIYFVDMVETALPACLPCVHRHAEAD